MDKKIKIRLIICCVAVAVALVFVFITGGFCAYLIKGAKYFENEKLFREKTYAYMREFTLEYGDDKAQGDENVSFTVNSKTDGAKTVVTLTLESSFNMSGGKVVEIIPLDTTLYEPFSFTAKTNGGKNIDAKFVSVKEKRKSTVYTFEFEGTDFSSFTVKGFLINEYEKR